jgi:hypothetical protein
MSSLSIQPFIDKLETINSQINNEIEIINATSDGKSNHSNSLLKMNQFRNEQENIYNLLKNVNENLYASFISAKTLNTHQINLADKLTSYKSDIEKDISTLQGETDHNIRLSKINTFYGDKYQAHSKLIKQIILILIPIIILAVLKNKGVLPYKAFNALMLVVFVVGGILFFKKYKDILSRDNMNYQEYNWAFRPDLAPNLEA